MTAPPALVDVQPLVNNKLVYLPMAPNAPGGKAQGRLMLELTITNQSTTTSLTATQLIVTFPSAGTNAAGARTINQMIAPASSISWNLPKAQNHYLFDLATAPTTVTVAVSFAGFSDPITRTLPLAPHVGPDTVGSYRFPSQGGDLKLGEFWQVNGCSHDPGNHQGYAYDMAVWGTNHGPDERYSVLLSGGEPGLKNKAPNSDYRIFGKPVRAMAAGEVIEIVNTCPNNATPLYPDPANGEDMTTMLDALKSTYDSFPSGEAGNHVLVQHGDEVAVYAHLQMGSIDKDLTARKPQPGGKPPIPGSRVSAGQILGLAGNSGRSSAPHLHIHSEKPPYSQGAPRPMLFSGAWAIDDDALGGPGAPAGTLEPSGRWVAVNGAGLPPGSPTDAYSRDSFLLPSGTPQWPEVVHQSVEENDYQALFDAMSAKGLSPAWINTHTIDKGPLYFYTFFNVVFRPRLGANEQAFHDLDAAQLSSLRTDLVDKSGFHVKQLDSYFSMRRGKQLFTGIFAKHGGLPPRHGPRTYHGKTFDEHWALANAWTAEGFVPTSVSVVPVKGVLSYTGLWEYRGASVTYDMEEHLTPASISSIFDRNHQEKRFMTYLKGYFHQGQTCYSGIWTSAGSDGKVRNDLRRSGFSTVLTQQRRGDHLLRSISGYQLDGDVAYAGIWAA